MIRNGSTVQGLHLLGLEYPALFGTHTGSSPVFGDALRGCQCDLYVQYPQFKL